MTTALTVFNAQVDILIETDTDIIASADVDAAVKAAVERYSRDAPYEETDDVSGDAGKYYAVATAMTNWKEGFSRITRIQYPAPTIASDESPVDLDAEDWVDDYWASDVRYLFLPNHAPAATETMRITFTRPYLWTGSPEVTATPTGDFYAICHLAAGLACQTLAAKFAQSKDSTVNVDSATHASKSSDYAARAAEFIAFYKSHMGLDADQVIKPSNTFVDFDTVPGWPTGRQYIFRNKGIR